jgi:hypothetical protein
VKEISAQFADKKKKINKNTKIKALPIMLNNIHRNQKCIEIFHLKITKILDTSLTLFCNELYGVLISEQLNNLLGFQF